MVKSSRFVELNASHFASQYTLQVVFKKSRIITFILQNRLRKLVTPLLNHSKYSRILVTIV